MRSIYVLFPLYCWFGCLQISAAAAAAAAAISMGQAISSTQFFVYGKRHFTQYV
jgi:hypothetical protein